MMNKNRRLTLKAVFTKYHTWKMSYFDIHESILNACERDCFENVVKKITKLSCPIERRIAMAKALAVASSEGHIRIVKYLETTGADLMGISSEGILPAIYLASRFGHVNVVTYLHNAGADIEFATHDGCTPFYIAAQNCHIEVMRYLHKAGSDVNRPAIDGDTPFFAACNLGNFEVVRYLHKEARVDTNRVTKEGAKAFHIACKKGRTEIVKYFYEEVGVDFNAAENVLHNMTPFHMACQSGNVDTVKYLTEEVRADAHLCSKDDYNPLLSACGMGLLEVVKYLSQQPAVDMNGGYGDLGCTPFYCACQQGQLEVAKFLHMEMAVDINTPTRTGTTPFVIACQYSSSIELIQYLLDSGVNIDEGNKKGWTALHGALDRREREGKSKTVDFVELMKEQETKVSDYLDVLELLILYGADLKNIFQDNFFTPAQLGDIPIHRLLSKKWSPMSHKIRLEKFIECTWYFSSLHAASYDEDIELLSALLESMPTPADLSAVVDRHGWNPLHVAVFMNRKIATKLLLTKGDANIRFATTHGGSTVFHLACARGYTELINLLLLDVLAAPSESVSCLSSPLIAQSSVGLAPKQKKKISSGFKQTGAFAGFKKGFLSIM